MPDPHDCADGAMNGVAFLAYVEQALVPVLSPGDIVVMDNDDPPAHLPVSGKPLKAPVLSCAICGPTVPTLTRSRWRFRSSKRCHVPRRSELSAPCGTPMEISSPNSDRKNSPTTLLRPDTSQHNVDAL